MTDIIRRTIRIARGALIGPEREPIYGWQDVQAYCLAGLAAHKSLGLKSRWKWTVTHEASGMKIDRIGAMTKADAVANMRAAVALGLDWTRPESEVIAALRNSRDMVDAVTEIGERRKPYRAEVSA